MDGRDLSPLAAAIFNEGIALVLSRWPAMEVAVMNECGGRDTRLNAQNLCQDVCAYFTTNGNEAFYIDDLEILIDKIMAEELGAEVDDGTIEEVWKKPIPRIYKVAFERAGKIAPEEPLHIGDCFSKDYIPAKSIGMQALPLDRFKNAGQVDDWRKSGATVLPALVAAKECPKSLSLTLVLNKD